MTVGKQHIPSPTPASNTVPPRAWALLGRACREVASASEPELALERLMEHLLESTGAERAFVVQTGDGTTRRRAPRVTARLSRRRDGRGMPSRTVLKRALAGPLLCVDATTDRRLSEAVSVRSMELRFVLAVHLPVPAPGRVALVIDSRLDHRFAPAALRELLEAFAALAALVLTRRERANPVPASKPRPSASEPELVGESPAFLELMARVRQVAAWPLPVLILGETGSGKEGVARALHRESPRRDGPFVAVNCAALPDGLLESELFGAVRGAYTGSDRDRAGLFRLAHGGTLFLDEIGDAPPLMQAKLLRALQEARVRPVGGESEERVDVRVVAATHRDLEVLVAKRRFRADLYYRVAILELHSPALRERREDIPLLVRHLGSRLARATGHAQPRWSPQALERLETHDWPGNIRELQAVLARTVLHADGEEILPCHVNLPETAGPGAGECLEKRMLESALRETGGVMSRAAERIGWSRQKLSRRMVTLGITRPTRRSTRTGS